MSAVMSTAVMEVPDTVMVPVTDGVRPTAVTSTASPANSSLMRYPTNTPSPADSVQVPSAVSVEVVGGGWLPPAAVVVVTPVVSRVGSAARSGASDRKKKYQKPRLPSTTTAITATSAIFALRCMAEAYDNPVL